MDITVKKRQLKRDVTHLETWNENRLPKPNCWLDSFKSFAVDDPA